MTRLTFNRSGLGSSVMITLVAFAGTVASAQQPIEPDAIRAMVAEMQADAATRSSLLAAGGGAGRDERGFFLASEDGSAKLYINGLVQFRYYLNFRDDADGAQDDFESGFQNRRTQLILSGNVTSEVSFRVQTEFRSDGSSELKDAYAQIKFENEWVFKAGQFKPPLLREELVGDLTQLAAERSVLNSVFNQGRSQGIEFSREFEDWRLAASFNDGLGASNTDFDSSREAEYGVTGRVDYKFAGAWKQFRDFSSWRGSEFAAMLGGALHYQGEGDTGTTADVDILEYTGDLSFEGDGWNAFAAFVGRNRDSTAGDFDDFGVIVQGGVFVSPQAELFARYDVVLPDDDRGATGNSFNTVSAGVSYYLFENSHAAQFRIQASWYLDAQSESIVSPSTNTGVLADTEGDQFNIIFEFGLQF